ncbi:MAG: hypothetical protein FWG13_04625 [Leptospirales bacterium]|nr:hypothetical protein [Leptospirales bacterium]
MKIKALFICSVVILYAAITTAANKDKITVVPLYGENMELTELAVTRLSADFSSLGLTVKELSPNLNFRADMSYEGDKIKTGSNEKFLSVRYGVSPESDFISNKNWLSGLRLRITAYGVIPKTSYYLYIMDNSVSSVIREAKIPVTGKDGIQEVDAVFEPIANSKNKSYSFTVVQAGIEKDDIIGVSVNPEPVNENKELGKLKNIMNFSPLYAGLTITDTEKNKQRDIGYLSSADYVVFTDVSQVNNTTLLTLNVYSADKKTLVFSTVDASDKAEDLPALSAVLAERVTAALSDTKLPDLFVEPTLGTSDQSVFISWKPVLNDYKARIYRSTRMTGPYSLIGTSNSSSHIDHTAEPGQLYWYKVQPFNEQASGVLSQAAPGYRKITIKKTDVQKFQAAKKLTPPQEKTAASQKAVKDEIALIKSRYMNSVELTVMMTFGKSYIDNGVVSVFENLPISSLDLRKREMYLLHNDALIDFSNKRIFTLRESTMPIPNYLIAQADFGAAGNADNYSPAGFSNPPQQDLRWNETDSPSLEFDIGKPASALFVDMHLAPPWAEEPYTCKKVEVLANEVSAGYVTVTGRGIYRVAIPLELVTSERLKLTLKVSGATNSEKIAFYSVSVSRKFLQQDLFSRLVDNGVFFCYYKNDAPVLQNDGTIRYVPQLSAVGMATEYYKNNKGWKSETLTFTTSDNSLMDKVKKSSKK